MKYFEIKLVADNILRELSPYCDVINIAGSIRREKEECKDIEIVCLPKGEPIKDLFGDTDQIERDENFISIVKGLGKFIKGNPLGRYCQIELLGNPPLINLDLFMPQKEDYYRQFAIRTGSSMYSSRVIAHAWSKKGWCGTEQGLRKRKECEENKGVWKVNTLKPTLPPVWQSEEEFFKWLGVSWIPPKERYVA